MNITKIRGTQKKNTLRWVPANNVVVYNSVMTVTSIVSCREMTTVHIYLLFMARKSILQTAVVCAMCQERETRCSSVEWSELNYLCLQGSSRRRETSSLWTKSSYKIYRSDKVEKTNHRKKYVKKSNLENKAASVPKFAGSKPGRSRRIFKGGKKSSSTPSFGREVKPWVPRRRFAACKRTLNVQWKSAFRQNLPVLIARP
jgi:hypothetical protein